MKRIWLVGMLLLAAAMLSGCREELPDIDNSTIDFSTSAYKHITNGGITEDEELPYNVDAITGATLTVEGPGVVSSTPLSIRELENRTEGLFRGAYEDSSGVRVYEGVDLYTVLYEMTGGDSGIFLTDTATHVELKDCNRNTLAVIPLDQVAQASRQGRPILLAYGVGTTDGSLAAPFVFDAKAEGEHSLGYVEELDNEDGCLRLVYDLDWWETEGDYKTFSNVAYLYVREGEEPGYKHDGGPYGSADYGEYILTFRGDALGAELDLTVSQLEALVRYDEDGQPQEDGLGWRDSYSLANNAYWYVNEYEGLDLYRLLCYLGMDTAEELGRAESRTTIVTFQAADGRLSPESFSVEALSYPDAFGFYNKNAADPGDGSYVPTNADLVDTGYPVLLAYGVNRYPYTVDRGDEGYLSGLANSGGPMRVVFGKTQYNHANGSNQVQYVSQVIVGEDVLYQTHLYADDPDCRALAEESVRLEVVDEAGKQLLERTLTVGEVENLVYGEGADRASASVKDRYQRPDQPDQSDVYEGVSLEYLLMDYAGLPGTVGSVTFSGGGEEVTVSLEDLFLPGYNSVTGKSGLLSVLAFAKNGAPLVGTAGDGGYTESLPLYPTDSQDPATYWVDNQGGPLTVLLPAQGEEEARQIYGVTSIRVELEPDPYAHLEGETAALADRTVTLSGPGLTQELTLTVAELESRQTQTKTMDFSLLDQDGLTQQRYRGIPVYQLLTEAGLCNNAGEVTVTSADGTSVTLPLSLLKGVNYTNYAAPEKQPVCALLAYGTGPVDGQGGAPLTEETGGPLKLVVPMDGEDAKNGELWVENVVSIQVSANQVDTWSHAMSDVYSEFLDDTMTLTIRNDDHEWTRDYTVEQLEAMDSLIVRDDYAVLELGTCEGIDLWGLVLQEAGDVPGIDQPVSVTAYASDGYKNDLLSVFAMDGLEQGVLDPEGQRKKIIIAYAINGAPLVDEESHEGYTGTAGNSSGPLRIIAETVQGASVKYFNKLVVTVPGSGPIG